MSGEIFEIVGQGGFILIALVVGGLVAARRKRQQQRDAEETQAQLRRVDEAIREARSRAGTGRIDGRAAAYVVPAQAAISGSIPFASPVEDPEGPNRDGAWEQEHAAKPKQRKPRPAPVASTEFAPPTAEELREAMMWREIFAPCVSMRS